ncbi:hypothetical protein GCM10023195_55800 [Actinoallomurus liliacearum]|uniref:Uncharacterized protein n=1 Tax=Actinoallomurus liliacearum TaxID=1080073 RepID=A0ABP8TSN4_9ACTN
MLFSGLHTGHAPYSYAGWFGTAVAAAGNMVGGILLVTTVRLGQVPHKLAAHRAALAPDVVGTPEDHPT